MRNLKKFLALVLAMMMVLSLMVTVNAATADFADAGSVNPAYKEAVDVLTELGIVEGEGNNELNPTGNFIREQLAVMAFRLGTGRDASDTLVENFRFVDFTDVPESNWANPYITYAHQVGWVHGVDVGQTRYDPKADVTGSATLTLMLQILGYGKQDEFMGTGWENRAFYWAEKAGLVDGLNTSGLTKTAQRQEVMQMMLNALKADIVTYSADKKDYVSTGETLGEKFFDLVRADYTDEWGRPGWIWFKDTNHNGVYDSGEKDYANETYPVVAMFAEALDECDVYEIIEKNGGSGNGIVADYWIDGVQQILDKDEDDYNPPFQTGRNNNGHADINARHQGYSTGDQGAVTEVYQVDDGVYHIVQRYYWLAKVVGVTDPGEDKNGHPGQRTIDFEVYVDEEDVRFKDDVELNDDNDPYNVINDTQPNDEFVRGNFILVNYCNGVWDIVGAAVKTTDETENVDFVLGKDKEYDRYTVWGDGLDEDAEPAEDGGNIIGISEDLIPDNHMVIEAMDWNRTGLTRGYAEANLWLDAQEDRTTESVISQIAVAYGATNAIKAGVAPFASEKTATIFTDIDGAVSDNYNNNQVYYNHIWIYDEGDDGYDITFTHKNVPDPVYEGTGYAYNYIVDIGHGYANYAAAGDPSVGTLPGNSSIVLARLYGEIITGDPSMYEGALGYYSNGAPCVTKVLGSKATTNGTSVGTDNTDDVPVAVKARADSQTVYLIWNSAKQGYERYVGFNDVPSVVGDICVAYDAYGVATFVVVTNVQSNITIATTNKFIAYVNDVNEPTGTRNKTTLTVDNNGTIGVTIFKVYKLGETKTTDIYIRNGEGTHTTSAASATAVGKRDDITNIWKAETSATVHGPGSATYAATGLYEFEVGEDGWVIAIKPLVYDFTPTNAANGTAVPANQKGAHYSSYNNWAFENVMATKAVEGKNLLYAIDWTSTTPAGQGAHSNNLADNLAKVNLLNSDYEFESNDRNHAVDDETVYILVTKDRDAEAGTVTKDSLATIGRANEGDLNRADVIITGRANSSTNSVSAYAQYVYIIRVEGEEKATASDYYTNFDIASTKDGAGDFNAGAGPSLSRVYGALRITSSKSTDGKTVTINVPYTWIQDRIDQAISNGQSNTVTDALPYLKSGNDNGDALTAHDKLYVGVYLGGLRQANINVLDNTGTSTGAGGGSVPTKLDYTITCDGDKVGDGTVDMKEIAFGHAQVTGDEQLHDDDYGFVWLEIGECVDPDTGSYFFETENHTYVITVKDKSGTTWKFTVIVNMVAD